PPAPGSGRTSSRRSTCRVRSARRPESAGAICSNRADAFPPTSAGCVDGGSVQGRRYGVAMIPGGLQPCLLGLKYLGDCLLGSVSLRGTELEVRDVCHPGPVILTPEDVYVVVLHLRSFSSRSYRSIRSRSWCSWYGFASSPRSCRLRRWPTSGSGRCGGCLALCRARTQVPLPSAGHR